MMLTGKQVKAIAAALCNGDEGPVAEIILHLAETCSSNEAESGPISSRLFALHALIEGRSADAEANGGGEFPTEMIVDAYCIGARSMESDDAHLDGLREVFQVGYAVAQADDAKRSGKYRFRFYQDSKGEWRWSMISTANGQVVGASHEGFVEKRACVDNLVINTGIRPAESEQG